MFNWKEIRGLIVKELVIEKRSKNILMSTLLYVFSTVFICYLAFVKLEVSVWNGLIWILVVFAMTNAANRIFIYESGDQRIYLYSLASANSIIISKLIYQWLVSGILALLVLLTWSILFSQTIAHLSLFIVVLLVGVWAMSNVLTLNNALSSGTKNSPTVLAILSFPVLLPILLTTIKASIMTISPNLHPDFNLFLMVLGLLNVLTVALSIILFQYLWRY